MYLKSAFFSQLCFEHALCHAKMTARLIELAIAEVGENSFTKKCRASLCLPYAVCLLVLKHHFALVKEELNGIDTKFCLLCQGSVM